VQLKDVRPVSDSRLDLIRRTLLQGAGISMGVRTVGVALSYAANVLLSRSLGLEAFGKFAIALSWALVLALPAKAGFDNSALRYGSIYFDKQEFGALRGFVRFSAVAILVVSSSIGVLIIIAGSRLVPADPVTRAWTAALLVPLALMAFYSVVLRAARWIVSSQLFEQMVRPTVVIVGIAIARLAHFGLTPASAMGLTAAAAVVALLGLVFQTRRALRPAVLHAPDYANWRRWLAVSLPLLMVGVVQEMMNQIDILLLGQLSDEGQAALFAASWRIASLVPFALVALGTMAGPLIASAYERGLSTEMHRVSTLVARFGFGFAIVSASFLYLLAGPLLGMFGRGFVAGEGVLSILLIGGIVNAFTGVVAYFTTLTGRERQGLIIFAGALILSIVLNVLLIPGFGAVGAAIASSSATIAWNLALLVYVRRTIGVDASAVGLAPRVPDGDARTRVA
jgi:O-antigen/teichoic acid export membrane protein